MLPYDNKLKFIARALRKNMTEQEKNLWYKYLRNHHVKFNRQKVIGKYIVDFYSNSAKLAIEIDGSQHYNEENKQYDKKRTEYLNSLGINVIRFSNDECVNNFDGVCMSIDTAVKKYLK